MPLLLCPTLHPLTQTHSQDPWILGKCVSLKRVPPSVNSTRTHIPVCTHEEQCANTLHSIRVKFRAVIGSQRMSPELGSACHTARVSLVCFGARVCCDETNFKIKWEVKQLVWCCGTLCFWGLSSFEGESYLKLKALKVKLFLLTSHRSHLFIPFISSVRVDRVCVALFSCWLNAHTYPPLSIWGMFPPFSSQGMFTSAWLSRHPTSWCQGPRQEVCWHSTQAYLGGEPYRRPSFGLQLRKWVVLFLCSTSCNKKKGLQFLADVSYLGL